jgi:peptidyl-prolyl cis-trans isomerase C
MKRFAMLAIFAAGSLPLFAQQAAAPAAQPGSQKLVATVNGEAISAQALDQLYDRLSPQMRNGYEKAGGKAAFLDNYLSKRVLVQEALKASFDKRPDVQQELSAARDSALFDRYVRDVVAAPFVTEAAMQQYYQAHGAEFAYPEMIKVRDIFVGTKTRTKEEAFARITEVRQKIFASERAFIGVGDAAKNKTPESIRQNANVSFARAAAQFSDDATASLGGELGWQARGRLDPTYEGVAYAQPAGTISRVVELSNGYHLIFVEDKKTAGILPFEAVRGRVRERVMAEHASEVMQAVSKLTEDLKAKANITVYPDNVQ